LEDRHLDEWRSDGNPIGLPGPEAALITKSQNGPNSPEPHHSITKLPLRQNAIA
jgi:hypothetical protein